MDTNVPDRVRQFVRDFWYKTPYRLRADTRLEEDLGITGADAAEFLNAFAEAFEVDLTGIEFPKHFGPECGPILFCPLELREVGQKGHATKCVSVRASRSDARRRAGPWPQRP
jgi:hypothetical protein